MLPQRSPSPQFSRFIKLTGRRTPQFAARCFRNGTRLNEHDVFGRRVGNGDRCRRDLPFEIGVLILWGSGLGEDNQTFGSGSRIRAAERHDPTTLQSRDVAGTRLDLAGIDVATGADDDVLAATGYEQVATDRIGEVAGVQPITAEQLASFLRITEITARRGWPSELKPSLTPVVKLTAAIVDDPDLVASKRLATRDQFDGRLLLGDGSSDRPLGQGTPRT